MLNSITLNINGMHCDGCVRRVRAALTGVQGVQVQDVKVGSARIDIDPAKTNVEGAVNAVNDLGFSAQVARG